MSNDAATLKWNFKNSYSEQLTDKFYTFQNPIPVPEPKTVCFNQELAKTIGLDFLKAEAAAIYLSGNQIPDGAQPIAQAYAGHQFGHFTMLGDGRAVLLGEQMTSGGQRLDVQLKGSGRTPYSRRGDGRATLSSMLREYLISEAMHHLGVPTTRSLAVVKTGKTVFREEEHEGAVLTRIASSHIRVGTFEYAKHFGTTDNLKELTDYVIQRHYPELTGTETPALELLKVMMDKQVNLIVDWLRVGFVHGVMNTDNMSIAGETIDYGPCAFMNAYHPETVFSSIDAKGRYAFINQPSIAHWNLGALASALLPLLGDDQEKTIPVVQELLNDFPILFKRGYREMMSRKLGVIHADDSDQSLIDDVLKILENTRTDYTNFFVSLRFNHDIDHALVASREFSDWKKRWEEAINRKGDKYKGLELMDQNNPIVIPRNHLVESALSSASVGNMTSFNQLLKETSSPYYKKGVNEPSPQEIPEGFDRLYQTFCGT